MNLTRDEILSKIEQLDDAKKKNCELMNKIYAKYNGKELHELPTGLQERFTKLYGLTIAIAEARTKLVIELCNNY